MRIGEENPDYKKRFLILEPEVVERLFSWHGGQHTPTYSLASTGLHNLVSPAMIESAIGELETVKRGATRKEKTELNNLIGDLDTVVSYPQEHSAEEAGMDIEEGDYEYSPNPSYTSLPWIIGYIVVGGIIYYLIYKKKKDEKTASSGSSSSSSLYGIDPTGFML